MNRPQKKTKTGTLTGLAVLCGDVKALADLMVRTWS
jgi:hypothetical protein